MKNTDKLKQYLLETGKLKKTILDKLEIKSSDKEDDFEMFAMRVGKLSKKDILDAKAAIYNLKPVDLSDMEINEKNLKLLPPKVADNYKMLIFDKKDGKVKVAMVDPSDIQAYEAIEFLTQQQGLEAEYYVVTRVDFDAVFKKYEEFKSEIGSALEVAREKFAHKKKDEKGENNLIKVSKTAPVAKIVSSIIEYAIEGKASDIHLEPGREEARVRYRVDGQLRTTFSIPSYVHSSLVSRIKVMARLKLDETRRPQDGRIFYEINGQEVDLRVSVLPMLDAEKVVMRILDNSSGVPSLSELGFSVRDIEILERNYKQPHGLFLLTGPTGSGKTTTLYSVLNMLNSDSFNITTLEDPIEYYINGVNQSQINVDVGFTFAKGLRAILRQDPNIIMVGEIRDGESANLVIHAALTGHLVFSTLHTNSAWGAIPRLVDMKVEPFLLSSTINMVMAQRLVRKICPECKKEQALPPNYQKRIEKIISEIPDKLLKDFNNKYKFYVGKGCSACGGSGYSGRTVISEIIEIDNKLAEMISYEKFNSSEVKEHLRSKGYVSLVEDGIVKALQSHTSVEEIMRVANE